MAKNIVTLVIILGIIVASAYVFGMFYKEYTAEAEYEIIYNKVLENNSVRDGLLALKDENPDVCAWISVNGTGINYPVMENEENGYYLRRDFNKNHSQAGSIFIDNRYTEEKVLHGHMMKNTAMFGDLKKYKKEDFTKEHQDIVFSDLEISETYRIIAVNLLPGEYLEDYLGTENIEKLLEIKLHGASDIYMPDDQLLQLVTCDNNNNKNRIVVTAVKREESGNQTMSIDSELVMGEKNVPASTMLGMAITALILTGSIVMLIVLVRRILASKMPKNLDL